MRPSKLFLILFLSLLATIAGAQIFQHPKLKALRQVCDSLECPEKYALNYRLLGEDLFLPLKDRLQALEIAETISINLADSYDLMAIYAQKGRINLDKGRYSQSLKAFAEGIQYAGYKDTEHWLEQEGWFLTGYGILLYRVNMYQNALGIFEDCASVFNRINDDYGEAVALNNIALCYSHLNQLDSAVIFFKKALRIRERYGQKLLMTHSLLYLAQVNRKMNNADKADSLLNQAIAYSEQADDFAYIGDIYAEWAEIARDDGELDKMANYLERARQMEHPFRDLRWLDLKIDLFSRKSQYDSLRFYIDTALVAVRDFGNLDLEVRYLSLKEKLCRGQGQVEEANAILREINRLNQSILSLKDSLQIEMMQVQSDFFENRVRLENLESSFEEKEAIIKTQNRVLLLVTIIAVILLLGILLVNYFFQKLKRATNRLHSLSQRTRLAADQMLTVIIAFNESQKVIFANRAAVKYFKKFDGLDLKEGQNFLKQLKSETLREDWLTYLKQAGDLSNYQAVSSPVFENRQYFYLVSLSEIQRKGRKEGTVAVLTDVTASYEKSLELSKKTRALERANEAKEKVLSLLAHDLKEGVVSSMELAKISKDPEVDNDSRKTHMNLIYESLGRTKTLLFKTLEWVKQQNDVLELKKSPLSIKRLCDDIIAEQKDLIARKKIRLVNTIDEDLMVLADPNAIRVIMRNLIGNAIKFVAPEKGLIRLGSELQNSQEVEISVKDNGRGLSPQQVANLLGGERLQSTQGTMGEKGTGMGLQLCQDFLYNMDSALQVESSRDKGTNFYFKLAIKSEAD